MTPRRRRESRFRTESNGLEARAAGRLGVGSSGRRPGLAAVLFATAVDVTQTTLVWVAAVERVIWTVETVVDVSISAMTTMALCVAIFVRVWTMVDVTVTDSALGLVNSVVPIPLADYPEESRPHLHTLVPRAYFVPGAATRSTAHLPNLATNLPVDAAVPATRTEVDGIAKAVVGPVGETVPPLHVQGAVMDAEEGLCSGERIRRSELMGNNTPKSKT